MAKSRVPLEGSGRWQASALIASVISSTEVASCKETSRSLGESGTAKISVSRTIYSVFCFVWWKSESETREEGRCRAVAVMASWVDTVYGPHELVET
jgi:hypothetical protein